MTIGIALIADSGRSVVMVADRRVATSDPYIVWDDESKISTIRGDKLICSAGTLFKCDEIIRSFETKLKDSSISAPDALCEAYRDCRLAYAVKENLYGLGISSLKELDESHLPDEKKESLIESMVAYDHDQILLLAHMADGSAEMGTISEPGIYKPKNAPGITGIGTSGPPAYRFLVQYGYKRSLPALHVLSIALQAKKMIEGDPYVGPGTDAAILTKDGVRLIPNDELEALEPAHREYAASVRAAQDVFRGCVVAEFEEA